jgi:hypothetical protein
MSITSYFPESFAAATSFSSSVRVFLGSIKPHSQSGYASSAPSSGSLPPFLMLIPVATVALCVCASSYDAAAAPFLAAASEPDAP